MLCQIVVEAEAYSSAPGLLRRGLEELLQHLLATFTTILEEQLPGESKDLQHLIHHVFAPCISDTSCVRMAKSTRMNCFGQQESVCACNGTKEIPFLISCSVRTFKTSYEIQRSMWRSFFHLRTLCGNSKLLMCAETNLGGTLQLLVDLKFLAGAFSPLVKGPHEASISACRQLIMEQAEALARGQGEIHDPLAERLAAWLGPSEVSFPIIGSIYTCY